MNKLEVIMYHYVRDLKNSRFPNIKGLDIRLFKEQLEYLKRNYTFVDIKAVLEAFYEGKRLPDNAVLLTFDDGYSDHYTNVFPILANEGISGVFAMPGKIIREQKMLDVNKIHYILASTPIEYAKNLLIEKLEKCRKMGLDIEPTEELYDRYAKSNRFDSADTIFVKRILQNAICEEARNLIADEMFRELVSDNEKAFVSELYLNMDQIRLMKKYNMHFALHGYEHYWFDSLSENQFKADIGKALDVFDGIIDGNAWTFCYPYGAHQQSLLDYCKSINCVAGFTVEPKIADLDVIDPLLIPRYDTNDYPPKSEVPKSRQ